MTQEKKDLLLKDICARLPYGVKFASFSQSMKNHSEPVTLRQIYYHNEYDANNIEGDNDISTIIEFVKPYLRPMSSMTQEEIDEYDAELDKDMDMVLDGALDMDRYTTSDGKHNFSKNFVAYFGNDWLDKNMFDYRGLIEKGLALEAPEGMYK